MNIERPRMKEINGENGNETIPKPSKLKIEELMDDLRCIIPDVLSLYVVCFGFWIQLLIHKDAILVIHYQVVFLLLGHYGLNSKTESEMKKNRGRERERVRRRRVIQHSTFY